MQAKAEFCVMLDGGCNRRVGRYPGSIPGGHIVAKGVTALYQKTPNPIMTGMTTGLTTSISTVLLTGQAGSTTSLLMGLAFPAINLPMAGLLIAIAFCATAPLLWSSSEWRCYSPPIKINSNTQQLYSYTVG